MGWLPSISSLAGGQPGFRAPAEAAPGGEGGDFQGLRERRDPGVSSPAAPGWDRRGLSPGLDFLTPSFKSHPGSRRGVGAGRCSGRGWRSAAPVLRARCGAGSRSSGAPSGGQGRSHPKAWHPRAAHFPQSGQGAGGAAARGSVRAVFVNTGMPVRHWGAAAGPEPPQSPEMPRREGMLEPLGLFLGQ